MISPPRLWRHPDRIAAARAAAEARNGQLTKPPGALGRLEEIAIWYAGWRGDARPRVTAPQVVVFAGNHGVAARGVSAFPPEVTVQMVANFEAGGAAINQLAGVAGRGFRSMRWSLTGPPRISRKARRCPRRSFWRH